MGNLLSCTKAQKSEDEKIKDNAPIRKPAEESAKVVASMGNQGVAVGGGIRAPSARISASNDDTPKSDLPVASQFEDIKNEARNEATFSSFGRQDKIKTVRDSLVERIVTADGVEEDIPFMDAKRTSKRLSSRTESEVKEVTLVTGIESEVREVTGATIKTPKIEEASASDEILALAAPEETAVELSVGVEVGDSTEIPSLAASEVAAVADLPGDSKPELSIDGSIKTPSLAIPEVTAELPELSVDVEPSVDVDVEVPALDATVNSTGIEIPSLAVPEVTAELPKLSVDVEPSVDVEVPSLDAAVTNLGSYSSTVVTDYSSSLDAAVNSTGIEIPSLAVPEVTAELPELSVDVEPSVDVDVEVPSLDAAADSTGISKQDVFDALSQFVADKQIELQNMPEQIVDNFHLTEVKDADPLPGISEDELESEQSISNFASTLGIVTNLANETSVISSDRIENIATPDEIEIVTANNANDNLLSVLNTSLEIADPSLATEVSDIFSSKIGVAEQIETVKVEATEIHSQISGSINETINETNDLKVENLTDNVDSYIEISPVTLESTVRDTLESNVRDTFSNHSENILFEEVTLGGNPDMHLQLNEVESTSVTLVEGTLTEAFKEGATEERTEAGMVLDRGFVTESESSHIRPVVEQIDMLVGETSTDAFKVVNTVEEDLKTASDDLLQRYGINSTANISNSVAGLATDMSVQETNLGSKTAFFDEVKEDYARTASGAISYSSSLVTDYSSAIGGNSINLPPISNYKIENFFSVEQGASTADVEPNVNFTIDSTKEMSTMEENITTKSLTQF
jgi:hypothetical protein